MRWSVIIKVLITYLMNNPRNDLRSTHFISLREVGSEESVYSPLTRKKMNNAAFIT